MNVPRLRFKEFSDAWEVKKLGDIATFSKGKGISKADIDENGKTFCIRYGELYTEYGETIHDVKSKTNVHVDNLVLSEINDVIIPASGETQIDIATASFVQVSGVALGGDLNIIKSQENGVFLTYYLNNQKKLDIAKLAQGNSVVHLYSSQLKLLDLNLPERGEQTKIANFLTALDEKIAQLKQKADLLARYKKGVMHQIFSQQLRFKDDGGQEFADWKVTKLDDITDKITTGATPSTLKKEYWKGDIRWMNSGELNLKRVFEVENRITKLGLNKSSTKLIPPKCVLIGLAGQGKTRGTVAMNMVELCTNQSIASIHPKPEIFDEEFLYHNLDFRYEELRGLSTGDGGRGGLNLQIIKSLTILLPSLTEQTKIANFLTALDDKITHNQTQLNALKQYKQGLLQQMFV